MSFANGGGVELSAIEVIVDAVELAAALPRGACAWLSTKAGVGEPFDADGLMAPLAIGALDTPLPTGALVGPLATAALGALVTAGALGPPFRAVVSPGVDETALAPDALLAPPAD